MRKRFWELNFIEIKGELKNEKRVSGFLLAAVLVAVMIMTSMPMGIKAAEGSGNNQLNVIQDSEVNLALKKAILIKYSFLLQTAVWIM